MDGEGAELYLRRVAEAALREDAHDRTHAMNRIERVAGVLISVGAIERTVAEAIESDLELALISRARQDPGQRRTVIRSAVASVRATARGPVSAGAARPGFIVAAINSAPDRAVAVNAVMPIDTDELRADLCFLGYAQTGTRARLAFAGVLEEKGQRVGGPHPAFHLFRVFTAEDDQGNTYSARLNAGGGGGDGGWSGELKLSPAPPPDIRWLDVSADGVPAVRIDLERETPLPRITVTESPLTPGEQYLLRLPGGSLSHGFGRGGLPEIVGALRAADALPDDSPVPDQLLAFLDGTARPGGLPERWRLAGEPSDMPGRAVAGLAVVLPELDGMRITLLGLRTGPNGSGIRVDATGVPAHQDGLPALGIRDQAGWHVTVQESTGWGDGEFSADFLIEPSLSLGEWIEVVVAGNTTEIHAEVPVEWKTL